MRRRENLGVLVLLLLLATSAFAVVTLGSPAGTRGDAPGPDVAQAARFGALQARLDELAAALARLEARECCPAPVLGAEPASAEPWALLRGDLQTLARGIEALELQVSTPQVAAPHGELATLRDSRPEVDWYSLDQVVATWRQDREQARKALRFLSPAELLERFGTPTRVRGEDDGEVRWTYGSAAEDAARAYRVMLSLHDGYVTSANVYAE